MLSLQEQSLDLYDYQFEVDHACGEQSEGSCGVVGVDGDLTVGEVIGDDSADVFFGAEMEKDEVAGVPVDQNGQEDQEEDGEPAGLES